VVSEIGKKEGFSLIFERRSGGLMYVSEAVDISLQVLKAYNESKKK
jgi:Skp family chaperone for outer membrane proteins